MLSTSQHKSRPQETRMLAMADRLFNDFDALPVKAVFDAICSARRTLRLQCDPATPEAIDRLARGRLHSLPGA